MAMFGASLLTALVVWLPTVRSTVRGDVALDSAAFRYLVAFGLSRLAWGAVRRLVLTYAMAPAPVSEDRLAGEEVAA
jgi:hypothetical protein